MALLQREDAARLLLFGGGFQRDALISMCRTALAACDGVP
jgi:chemotaxis protein methyltransferase CheR